MPVRKSKPNINSSTDAHDDKCKNDSISENPDNVIQIRHPFISTSSIVPEFAITLKEAKKRIDMLKKFVDELMTPGIDYGIVPGVEKPTLLKPGAEKLCDVFGFSKRIEVTNRLEDWYHGVFNYEVKVILICKRTGIVESEGVGSCNSRESRYYNQRGHDLANTILKMSKKRALVDAILSATRSSDLFTQDVEEMEWLSNKKQKATDSSAIPATRKQLSFIFSIIEQKRISFESAKELMVERYNVSETKQLSLTQASDFIDFLKAFDYTQESLNKKPLTD